MNVKCSVWILARLYAYSFTVHFTMDSLGRQHCSNQFCIKNENCNKLLQNSLRWQEVYYIWLHNQVCNKNENCNKLMKWTIFDRFLIKTKLECNLMLNGTMLLQFSFLLQNWLLQSNQFCNKNENCNKLLLNSLRWQEVYYIWLHNQVCNKNENCNKPIEYGPFHEFIAILVFIAKLVVKSNVIKFLSSQRVLQ